MNIQAWEDTFLRMEREKDKIPNKFYFAETWIEVG